jgi:thiamine-monophosphate kinase
VAGGAGGVNELDLIASLVPLLARANGDLLVGPGEDDVAAWREPGGIVVATCDSSIEGVHFDLGRQRPEDVGWRALCFALGDLAAKGARPTYGLAALAIPRGWDAEIALGLYRGLAGLAAEVGLRLAGGDTTAAPSHAMLTLFLLGAAPAPPLPRSAVRPGWQIGVTGPLGSAGLHRTRPRPRLELGAELASAGLCCGDISDGLVRELDKFAAAAGVGARLELEAVPVAAGATPERALASGEEVELVCCGPALPASLTRVGELTADGRVVVVNASGDEVEIRDRGYDHFA